MKKDITWKRIGIYIGITFVLTYIYEIFVVGTALKTPSMAPFATILISIAMFFPLIGSLLTRLVTKEGLHNMWLRPNFKKSIPYYLMAWLLPLVLTLLGALVYFLIFPAKYDSNMTSLAATYAAQNIPFDPVSFQSMIVMQLGLSLITAPILNFIPCLGEELGWRGYLVPKMSQKLSILPTLLISGIIWGLWHAPLTAMGHNYGLDYPGFPFLGIFAMCIFCVVQGILFSYVSLKAKSCIPAVIGHAMLNGVASFASMFAFSDGKFDLFIGPMPIGLIGGSAFIVTAIILVIIMVRQEKQAVESI